ncbi:methyltransferase type 11 [Candidatus Vecturithrix granuli]|uniref:Methyltransferase type 11 n=1 Tax=Vecturithrix granuli TaxID=1499967 RepID=A0A081BXE9_VECG1|nr:methyltransferase type 11 [Candidatus Vecturithrix granuli]
MREPFFSTFHPAVEQVLRGYTVQPESQFRQMLRDELAEIPQPIPHTTPQNRSLHELYELRACYLDWELGTGYLGFFAQNAGTRYTFTRRLEVVLRMLAQVLHQKQGHASALRILEIGCGAGLLCLELARSAKIVVGIDISHFVLDFANRVKDYLHCDNVFFQQGDAEHLAFDNDTFDVVICSEVLEHLIKPQQALTEMRRVLKKDGTLILTTPCALSLSDLCMNLLRLIRPSIESEKDVHFDKKTYLALQRQGKQPDAKTFLRVHTRFHYNNLLAMIKNAGFEMQHAVGTVFAFPPHYQVFYRYCPALLLPAIRFMENLLNRMSVFQRVGAVTTCFRLKSGDIS